MAAASLKAEVIHGYGQGYGCFKGALTPGRLAGTEQERNRSEPVGHNHTPRSIQSGRDREAERERVLPGWRLSGDKLEPLETAEGVLARGGVIHGRCKTEECRRYVRMDLHACVSHGFGSVGITTLERHYQCSRLACSLRFDLPLYPGGIPIQCFVGTPDQLEILCRKCRVGRRYAAEEVISSLVKAGTGDGNVGVHELARRIRGQRPTCRYGGWIVEIRRA